ncbi:hypothetical protein ACWGH7_34555 [Streptomyces cyaneofuscatus]|uniref:hypothetical protein n=1 Tax=Streptomyces TaxID=1883 RepID=UPI0004C68279|nr:MULTISPECIES: hypothetical protein [Streptomyces]ONI55343.1 Penicillin-binding protein activator LpoB [Streptomyces sp. IB2014 011-1]RDV53686.1 hypothetical protein DDV98_01955 [Streptomyces sp. IB2014 011-12]CAD5951648.1 Penicillin-binding protein activator LpoB [Streptomyces sp. KY70]CAD5983983.1 Penicillin-binding protein activator LpoB [Streptomyces sp. KY75]
MSMRRTTMTRRAMTAVTVTAALALALTGCGDDGGEDPQSTGSTAPSAPASPSVPEDKGEPQQEDTAVGENVDPDVKLAETRGQGGLVLVINEVKRDTGGFLTVQGAITNEGDQARATSAWSGAEVNIVNKNPNSVAGATLVDKAGKKRYYVLRDTDSRCLCTTAITSLAPGKTAPIFMQFPAPPQTTTEVDFALPTFATTSLKISG